jgi:DNA-binding LytR/AlgR family response regulator
MTTVVILEDEAPARRRLEQQLRKLEPGIAIAACLATVADAQAWFAQHPAPDLVLADIQLADGLSFEVFQRVATAPVVFCTAYDEYAMEAMAAGGIEYLVKPIKDAELARALAHYRRLEAHFAERVQRVATQLARPPQGVPVPHAERSEVIRPPRRLLARHRDGFVTVPLDDVAYFALEDKLVDVIARDGRRMRIDRTLSDLEAELDPAEFFRINRQYLVAASSVRGFKPLLKGKLLVELAPAPAGDVVVSQETAPRFRTWVAR